MTIFTGTFIPYEFNKYDTFAYIAERCYRIKKSLKYIEMDSEHLEVRCPLSGEYLTITGDEQDLRWLHSELVKKDWYKLT